MLIWVILLMVLTVAFLLLVLWFRWPQTKERRLLNHLKRVALSKCKFDDEIVETFNTPRYMIACPEGFGASQCSIIVYTITRRGVEDFVIELRDTQVINASSKSSARLQTKIVSIIFLRLAALGHPALRRVTAS